MTKKEFQTALAAAGLYQWQVADRLGIQESYLCKLLRKDLSEEMSEKIRQAIKELSEK